MELYIIEDYKGIYPALAGKELTDALVGDILIQSGALPAGSPPRIRRLATGKPVLDPQRGICFSVSHTGSTFGCLISTVSVGLDLQMDRAIGVSRLARRWFAEEEIRYLEEGRQNGPCGVAFRRRFFRLWTRKEAYAKYTGQGLQAVLDGICVLGRRDVRFYDLDFGDGLYGCICVRRECAGHRCDG